MARCIREQSGDLVCGGNVSYWKPAWITAALATAFVAVLLPALPAGAGPGDGANFEQVICSGKTPVIYTFIGNGSGSKPSKFNARLDVSVRLAGWPITLKPGTGGEVVTKAPGLAPGSTHTWTVTRDGKKVVSAQFDAPDCGQGDPPSGPWIQSKSAPVRSCISLWTKKCSAVSSKGPLAVGTPVTMKCWAWGDKSTGIYASRKWFFIRVVDGKFQGNKGWVHSSYVTNQRTDAPRCSGAVPSLGTAKYDGKSAKCSTALVKQGGKQWCKNADFKGSNGKVNSPRGYAWRNCTDYAAWQMDFPYMPVAGHAHAKYWDDYALAHLTRFAIDTTPNVGDVAQRDTTAAGRESAFGHVAVVVEVGSGTKAKQIRIAQYNAGAATIGKSYYGDGLPSTKWVPTKTFSKFIRRIS